MRKTIALIAVVFSPCQFSRPAAFGWPPETFAQKCPGCHGKDGKGQTRWAEAQHQGLDHAKVQPRPRTMRGKKSPSPEGVKE